MKRFFYLFALMALSSSAHADSFSFMIRGHRVHIDAPRHCFSPSCVAISIPGVYSTGRKDIGNRDRDDGIDATPVKSPASAPEQAAVRPAAPPAGKPSTEPVASAPPPAIEPPKAPAVTPATPPIEIPAVRTPPAVIAAPRLLKVSHEREDEPAETPVGDWQNEGKTGSVRIQQCGAALCGYVLNASSNVVGESVLINMKPKAGLLWSGGIYSRDSGSTYYGTIAMKGPNSLRVEACVLGRFFCSGNIWSRIAAQPESQVTSRQASPPPRS
jgi:uncharacterized protein (DUF2147 family)